MFYRMFQCRLIYPGFRPRFPLRRIKPVLSGSVLGKTARLLAAAISMFTP
jgi:hypothetical protein